MKKDKQNPVAILAGLAGAVMVLCAAGGAYAQTSSVNLSAAAPDDMAVGMLADHLSSPVADKAKDDCLKLADADVDRAKCEGAYLPASRAEKMTAARQQLEQATAAPVPAQSVAVPVVASDVARPAAVVAPVAHKPAVAGAAVPSNDLNKAQLESYKAYMQGRQTVAAPPPPVADTPAVEVPAALVVIQSEIAVAAKPHRTFFGMIKSLFGGNAEAVTVPAVAAPVSVQAPAAGDLPAATDRDLAAITKDACKDIFFKGDCRDAVSDALASWRDPDKTVWYPDGIVDDYQKREHAAREYCRPNDWWTDKPASSHQQKCENAVDQALINVKMRFKANATWQPSPQDLVAVVRPSDRHILLIQRGVAAANGWTPQ